LRGEKFELKHGYVAVKWRSPEDIKAGKTIKQALEDEEEFFKDSEYAEIGHPQGIKYLSQKISGLMQDKIEETFKTIESKIRGTLGSK